MRRNSPPPFNFVSVKRFSPTILTTLKSFDNVDVYGLKILLSLNPRYSILILTDSVCGIEFQLRHFRENLLRLIPRIQ